MKRKICTYSIILILNKDICLNAIGRKSGIWIQVSGFPNGLSSPNAMEFNRELSCKECKVSPRAALQGSGVQVPLLNMSQGPNF